MTSEGGMSPADYAAITGNGNGFGYGGFSEWIIVLFLFAMFGGWGNGFGGNSGGNNLYPWLNQSDQINNGFMNQMINDNVTGIRDGVYGISNQLCAGFAGVNAGVANGFAQAEIANNARQIADMQQMFNLQSALQNCCCENRAATADLKYTVATENCADRTAAMQNTRDIIESNTRNTQAIIDKLCQLELDGVKAENANLRTQLNMANLQASQVAQTAELHQSGATQLNQLVSELRSCPIPAQPVYGSQPIFTCGGNGSTGCGCGL